LEQAGNQVAANIDHPGMVGRVRRRDRLRHGVVRNYFATIVASNLGRSALHRRRTS
jgi:hypothetical protein